MNAIEADTCSFHQDLTEATNSFIENNEKLTEIEEDIYQNDVNLFKVFTDLQQQSLEINSSENM